MGFARIRQTPESESQKEPGRKCPHRCAAELDDNRQNDCGTSDVESHAIVTHYRVVKVICDQNVTGEDLKRRNGFEESNHALTTRLYII